METAFKSPKCQVEFQRDHNEDNRGGYACFDCLIADSPFDDNSYMSNAFEAIRHLNAHVKAGHAVPPKLIRSLQQAVEYQSIVHQSAMEPTRRHDGSFSGTREKAFHDKWMELQDNHKLLELMRCVDMLPVTSRDATVAATVIGWLGTNVGFCFVEQAVACFGYKIIRDEKKDKAQ